jgi:hypothetical protein
VDRSRAGPWFSPRLPPRWSRYRPAGKSRRSAARVESPAVQYRALHCRRTGAFAFPTVGETHLSSSLRPRRSTPGGTGIEGRAATGPPARAGTPKDADGPVAHWCSPPSWRRFSQDGRAGTSEGVPPICLSAPGTSAPPPTGQFVDPLFVPKPSGS